LFWLIAHESFKSASAAIYVVLIVARQKSTVVRVDVSAHAVFAVEGRES
jgi:hypothetical protein